MNNWTKHFWLFAVAGAMTSSALAQTLVERLRNAGNMSFHLQDGQYTIKVANCTVQTFAGNLGPQDPIAIQFEEHGSGTCLDFQISLQQMVNSIQSNQMVTFRAQILADNEIKWTADENLPENCTEILIGGDSYYFQINRAYGSLHFQISEIACQTDSILGREVNLELQPIGGDTDNNIGFDGYVWIDTLQTGCGGNVQTGACANANALQMSVHGGTCTPCPENGDVDNNGCVDDADLLAVLFAFGSSGCNLGCVDTNADGVVDDADLLIVLFNFGSGC